MFAGMIIFRRKLRSFYQRIIIVTLLLGISIFIFSYLNLEFCYRILSSSSLNHMCIEYRDNQYSGTICEDLCNGDSFKDFKCPQNSMKTIVFTAVKDNQVYAIKLAKHIKDDLTWHDKNGKIRYPEMVDFQKIVKTYITITYNLTIDDSFIHKLMLDQDIQDNIHLWRLLKDNNFMLGKLFDKELIFPTIYGTCGPFYATENLNSMQPETGIRHYITIDWEGRLKFAIMILEFLRRLDGIKPEPLKICKIQPHFFGLTSDKKMKYIHSEYIQPELQVDKILADGSVCLTDKDCMHEHCLGQCDSNRKICNGQQQNNNLQILCQHIFKGSVLFPGLLATAKAPSSLITLLNICIDPSKNVANHIINRQFAPNVEIGIQLYNEIKRIHNELTFHQ